MSRPTPHRYGIPPQIRVKPQGELPLLLLLLPGLLLLGLLPLLLAETPAAGLLLLLTGVATDAATDC